MTEKSKEEHLKDPATKKNYEHATLAYFVKTQDELWLRVDFVAEDDLVLHCHDENSGEEYALDLTTEQDLTFYTVEEMH